MAINFILKYSYESITDSDTSQIIYPIIIDAFIDRGERHQYGFGFGYGHEKQVGRFVVFYHNIGKALRSGVRQHDKYLGLHPSTGRFEGLFFNESGAMFSELENITGRDRTKGNVIYIAHAELLNGYRGCGYMKIILNKILMQFDEMIDFVAVAPYGLQYASTDRPMFRSDWDSQIDLMSFKTTERESMEKLKGAFSNLGFERYRNNVMVLKGEYIGLGYDIVNSLEASNRHVVEYGYGVMPDGKERPERDDCRIFSLPRATWAQFGVNCSYHLVTDFERRVSVACGGYRFIDNEILDQVCFTVGEINFGSQLCGNCLRKLHEGEVQHREPGRC